LSDARYQAIADLIEKHKLSNQAQVHKHLKALGFETTQSSISRDLRKMGVVKVKGIYTMPSIVPGESALVDQLHAQMAGDNMIVLRSTPGNGNRAGFLIDSARIPEVVGTIAGDDTIFVAVKNRQDQIRALKKIFKLFQQQAD
jgi:transcriptional regulator of arginine metabolism